MQIYRKRFEPDECVLLKDDEIVYADRSYICTKWETLKPRDDFDSGASIYDIKNGVKVSKFCKNGRILYYYIDIIGIEYSVDDDSYLCTDYVLDIVLQTDHKSYTILDEDELDVLIENGTLNSTQVAETYSKLNFMVTCIEENNFNFYLEIFDHMGL